MVSVPLLSDRLNEIAVEVRQGTQRDAVLYSCGANATHGLRRTNADKRRAVLRLLEDSEWSQWSDREIARQCGVSNRFVSNLRKSICERYTDTKLNTERKVQRGGTTYTVNTANIGSSKAGGQLPQSSRRVLVQGNHPASGQSGTITQVPNSYSAIVQLDTGGRELIELKYLVWEGTNSVNSQQLTVNSEKKLMTDDCSLITEYKPPQKVEVHINDICIAFISNLDSLSTAHIKSVGKALAVREPKKASVMAEAIAQQSQELSVGFFCPTPRKSGISGSSILC